MFHIFSFTSQSVRRDWLTWTHIATVYLLLYDEILDKSPGEMDGQKKRKGGAERERIRKTRATDAAKCCKISGVKEHLL